MGGYGTYKFATQYPDLFARANPVVGPPGLGIWVPPAPPQPGGDGEQHQPHARLGPEHPVPDLERKPRTSWSRSPAPVAQAQTFDDLGYRYRFDLFTTADHFALAVNDQYAPAAAFLGTHEVNRNPAHVTYVVNPTMDFPGAGTVADHAYWLSGLKLRDSGGSAPLGQVDARSEGFGRDDPAAEPDPNSARDAPGRQPRPDALRRAVEELGRRAADDRPTTSSISTPRTWPGSSSTPPARASAATRSSTSPPTGR